MTRKSATDLAEDLAALAHQLTQHAGTEARTEVAREIEHRFLGGPTVDRGVYAGRSAEDCVLLELTDNPALQKVAALRALVDRFEDDGIPADFRAGVLFAVRLMADPEFDY